MQKTTIIVAETKRRKQVWEKIEAAAVQALKGVDHQAQDRGVVAYRWIGPSLPSLRITFRDNGADRILLVGMRRSGRITPWLPVDEASQTYGGYPDFSDKAPELFKEAVAAALQTMLDKYRTPKW